MNTEEIEISLNSIANAIRKVGVGDAATPMGAIELLAMETKESGASISSALERIADALENVAEAIGAKK